MWIYCNGDEFTETYRCDKCGHRVEINLEIFREPLPEKCPHCGNGDRMLRDEENRLDG